MTDRARPESTGPVPPGTPPAAATPNGGPTAAGPSPTGHPSTPPSPAGDVEQAEAAVEQDLDVARLARERDDYLDALKRLQADFENYKKRVLKQQTEHLERAAEGLVEKLLPVLDTFDLALKHGGDGLDQVQGQLMAALEKEGLERIEPLGKPFDPNDSEAVAHEEGDDGPGVTEVMRTGNRVKGKQLRPAMVKVKG
ncbi:MAG: nucleotide exchange factor GrpE [Acidimicrobiia bacterium]|nr:nucleotide exchange factor GrpE [Acidimicrobiia bacterium]